MNFRIALEIKDKNWSKKERSEILQWALEFYLSKSRQERKIDDPSSNHIYIVEVQSSDSKESQSNSSDSDSYNLSGKDNSYNEQPDEDESL